MLRQVQLRWIDHLLRMDDERLPKRLLYGDVITGSRRRGGQSREDGRSNLRSLPHHRRRSQTRGWQISTAPTCQRQRSAAPDLTTVPADGPETNRSHWTSSNQLQHPDDTTRCLPLISATPLTPTINTDHTPEFQLPSSSIASTSAVTAPAPTATAINPNTLSSITLTTANISDAISVVTYPHCDRAFTSHVGLVGHL
nr:unnamed protein product [Spirometra erinaceieuropaei]